MHFIKRTNKVTALPSLEFGKRLWFVDFWETFFHQFENINIWYLIQL